MTSSPDILLPLASLTEAARARVRAALAGLVAATAGGPLPGAAQLEEMLFAGARPALERLVAPTLALELNVARLRGELDGPTPEDRYAAFVAGLAQPARAAALRAEYPALFDLAAKRLDLWAAAGIELVERLRADWPSIRAALLPGEEPGLLHAIAWPQRSTKRGGRAVAILSFASGARLVYKPRSLAADGHFQALLGWLNERGFQPAFRPLPQLDRGTHGWMAWVEAGECATADGVRRFYRRQGAYLALLDALEATDFHLSNIIAAGEHPALIDLEALFHPRDADPAWPPLDLALDALTYQSVLRVGLLPEPEPLDDGRGRFDLGGLTGAGGQATPYTTPRWRDRGTDHMRLVHEPYTLGESRNQPLLGGGAVDARDYLSALDEGYADAYRLLVAHRAALLSPDGPLARFEADEVRVLPRSGGRYGELLDNSYHPDLLRRADARRRYFARALADDDPALAALVPFEVDDLLASDTPLFTTRPGSRALFHRGQAAIAGYFPRSGLAAAQERIEALGEADLARQRGLIRAAFATVAEDTPGSARPRETPPAAPPDLAGDLFNAARDAAARLEASAVRAGAEASWLGLALTGDGFWALEPLDVDLYNGLPGVALFLAHLGALTGETRWTELARAALATFRRLLVEEQAGGPDPLAPLGYLDGVGGQLCALAHLVALWGPEPRLIEDMAGLAGQARAALADPAEDEAPGLDRGVAGCLVGLLAVHSVAPQLGTLAAAERAGAVLLDLIQDDAADDPYDARSPFATYLTGRAGGAAALLELAARTGDGTLRGPMTAIVQRSVEANTAGAGHWLAYLSARPWAQSDAVDAALAAALPVLLADGTDNHSLGRGDLGNLDLALLAAEALGDPALGDLAARHAAAVLADIRAGGPRCGTPLTVETPGLMVGLAGIGYGLLRLAAPRAVPSVLAPAALREVA